MTATPATATPPAPPSATCATPPTGSWRSATGTGSAVTPGQQQYSFTGAGDTPDLTLDATTHTIAERTTALPGGVTRTQRPTNPAATNQVWAYPNLHGDITATTGPNGDNNNLSYLYDPYGQPAAPPPWQSAPTPTPSPTPPPASTTTAGSANTNATTNTPAPSPSPRWAPASTTPTAAGSSPSTPSKAAVATTTTTAEANRSTPLTLVARCHSEMDLILSAALLRLGTRPCA